MKGLLIKDFYMAKKHFILFLIIPYVTLILSFVAKSLFWANNFIFILSLIPVYIMAIDEMYKWNKYEAFLPISKASAVLEKYVLLLISILPYMLIYTILLIFFKQDIQTIISEFSILLFMGTVIPSILLPIVFKSGYVKAKTITLVFIALYMAITVVINAESAQLNELIIGIYAPREKSYINAIIAVVLFGISMLLSISFYKKREF